MSGIVKHFVKAVVGKYTSVSLAKIITELEIGECVVSVCNALLLPP